jgi:hypothetical protein
VLEAKPHCASRSPLRSDSAVSATTAGAGKICSGIQRSTAAMCHSSTISAGSSKGQPLSLIAGQESLRLFKIICDISVRFE